LAFIRKKRGKKYYKELRTLCQSNTYLLSAIHGHQLPAARVTSVRFYNTEVDYCGSFFVRDRVRRNSKQYKAYVSVFMVTKTVHLKLVENVTSAAFIGALKRFVSRRGKAVNVFQQRKKFPRS